MPGILVLGFWMFSPSVFAANFGCVSSPNIPGIAVLDSIAIDASLPVGSIIPGSEIRFSFSGNCAAIDLVPQGIAIISCYYGSGTEIAGMPGVYDTGISGIGITLINSSGVRITGAGSDCDTRNTPLGYISNTAGKTFSVDMTLALVKIGTAIGSGTLSRSRTTFGIGMYNTGWGLGSNPDSSVSYSGSTKYRSISCSVDAIITVPLYKVTVADFNGIGSTAGDTNFNIPVRCDAPANVSLYMTSSGYLSKAEGVLALTAGMSNAGGIGIQVLHKANAVIFDNYFNVGRIMTSGELLNIPFVARYYQAGTAVTPGIANATATITLAYQ